MSSNNLVPAVIASLLITLGLASPVAAKSTPSPTPPSSAPPAPAIVAPANGASLVQPIMLDWNSVSAAGGPIGSYTWQISTTSGLRASLPQVSQTWNRTLGFQRVRTRA
jgi:hypothetical protein